MFTLTGTTQISDIVTLAVDDTNASMTNLVAIHKDLGYIYQLPITQVGKWVSLDYSLLTTEDENQIVIGSKGHGSNEIIKLNIGNNIIINPESGLLDSVMEIGGFAGGDFEGEFPNPNIRTGAITPDKLAPIPPNSLLGNGSVINLGPEFYINAAGNLSLVSPVGGKIVSTGFITTVVTGNTTAVPTTIYLVNSGGDLPINIVIPEGWANGEQVIIVNRGNGNVKVFMPTESIDFETEGITATHLICDGQDKFYSI
jgi:hypothetical protein